MVEFEPPPLYEILGTVWAMISSKKRTDNQGEAILDHYLPLLKAYLVPNWLKPLLRALLIKTGRHGELFTIALGS